MGVAPDWFPAPDPTRGFWPNALVGAVVAVVLSFVPLSPVLGGLAAGYLHGEDGGRVGGASGLLAAVPTLTVLFPFAAVFLFDGVDAGELLVVAGGALVVWFAVSAGLGAAGGYLGVVLAGEYGPARATAGPD